MIVTAQHVTFRGKAMPYGVAIPEYDDTFRAVSLWIAKSLARNTEWCWRRGDGKTSNVYFHFLKVEDAMACALRWHGSSQTDQKEYQATFLASL